jgi:hypothetical protein
MERIFNTGDWSSNMINVSETTELEYWCDFFRVTPEQLKTAIRAIHDCAADKVNEYLETKPHYHN